MLHLKTLRKLTFAPLLNNLTYLPSAFASLIWIYPWLEYLVPTVSSSARNRLTERLLDWEEAPNTGDAGGVMFNLNKQKCLLSQGRQLAFGFYRYYFPGNFLHENDS